MAQRYTAGAITIAATGVNITTGAVSASATIPNDSSGSVASYVYVACTAAARIRMGVSAATAVATDLMLRPELPLILQVPKGITKIAAIQDTAAGTVSVAPLENA